MLSFPSGPGCGLVAYLVAWVPHRTLDLVSPCQDLPARWPVPAWAPGCRPGLWVMRGQHTPLHVE
jgi:hypothetical protein